MSISHQTNSDNSNEPTQPSESTGCIQDADASVLKYRRSMSFHFPKVITDRTKLKAMVDFIGHAADPALCDIITSVDLSGNKIVGADEPTSTLLGILLQQKACHSLDFSETSVDVTAAKQISSLLRTTPLKTLTLRKLHLNQTSAMAFANHICEGIKNSQRLEKLDVSGSAFFAEPAAHFLQAVADARHLRELCISDIEFREDEDSDKSFAFPPPEPLVKTLLKAFSKLEKLEFGSNNCKMRDMRWCDLPQLQSLNLNHAQDIGGLRHIATATNLLYLDLSRTPLDFDACVNVAALLRHPDAKLKSIKLADCALDGNLMKPLIDALISNHSVTEAVDFSGCALGDVPLDKWRCLAPRFHRIKRVILKTALLQSAHIEEMVRAVYEQDQPSSALEEIDISDNDVGNIPEGADWCAELLHMPCIHSFFCGDNSIRNGTAIYLKLKHERERENRKMSCEVCTEHLPEDAAMRVPHYSSKGNVFEPEQLTWLSRHKFTKVQTPESEAASASSTSRRLGRNQGAFSDNYAAANYDTSGWSEP